MALSSLENILLPEAVAAVIIIHKWSMINTFILMNAAKKVGKSNVALVFNTASNNRKSQIQTLKQMIINYT